MAANQLSNLLKTRMGFASIIAEKSSKYLDIVKEIVMGINPSQYKDAIIARDRLREIVNDIPSRDILTDNILLNAISLYDELIIVDKYLRRLIQVFENETYAKMAIYNMSSTYVINIHHEKNQVFTAYEQYLDITARDDIIIIKTIIDSFDVKTNVDDGFNFVLEHESKVNKFMTKLISVFINVFSGEKRRRLELIIEQQKDLILGSTRKNISAHAGPQGMIVRYGLRPITQSMHIEKLFEHLGAKYSQKSSIEENLRNLANAHGVIFLNNAGGAPVEFDVRGLIDLQYVTTNDFKTTPTSGLTKKIIDRFNTAKLLTRGGKAAPMIKIPGKNSTWYIIESISPKFYRLLSRDDKLVVPADAITGMLNGLSLRADMYNSILAEEIIAKCYDPTAQLLLSAYEDEKTSQPSPEPIKTAVIEKLTNYIINQLKKNPVTSGAQFKNIVVNRDVIGTTLAEVLTHSRGIHGKGSAEYMITYLAKLDSIIYNFIRELERRWLLEEIPDRMFKELNNSELEQTLITIFKNVTTASVDELDRTRIWTEYDTSLKEFFLDRKQAIV